MSNRNRSSDSQPCTREQAIERLGLDHDASRNAIVLANIEAFEKELRAQDTGTSGVYEQIAFA